MIYQLKRKWWSAFGNARRAFENSNPGKTTDLRSDSDHSIYLAAVREFVQNPSRFRSFKRDPRYNQILEHVTFSQGADYLKILRGRDDGVIQMIKNSIILERDYVGNPFKFTYPGEDVLLSPTTLRYIKVASDLKKLFGDCSGVAVEIGCGYGGQCVVNDNVLGFSHYVLIDLLEVCKLIDLYLDTQLLKNSYETLTLNRLRDKPFDLVISNYAFSEMPMALQRAFVVKILKKSPRGYLTMNSGYGDGRRINRYHLEDLRNCLPSCEIFQEIPLTNKNNYLIVWGHNRITSDLGLKLINI
jgi:putative sugar O-methyltransferase